MSPKYAEESVTNFIFHLADDHTPLSAMTNEWRLRDNIISDDQWMTTTRQHWQRKLRDKNRQKCYHLRKMQICDFFCIKYMY